eukprot:2882164-Rhodomonas_salina.1
MAPAVHGIRINVAPSEIFVLLTQSDKVLSVGQEIVGGNTTIEVTFRDLEDPDMHSIKFDWGALDAAGCDGGMELIRSGIVSGDSFDVATPTEAGVYVLCVTITDSQGVEAMEEVSGIRINTEPYATRVGLDQDDSVLSVDQEIIDGATTVNVTFEDARDPDNYSISFRWGQPDVSGCDGGSENLECNDDWREDGSACKFDYHQRSSGDLLTLPAPIVAGVYSLCVDVIDSQGLSDSKQTDLVRINTAPLINIIILAQADGVLSVGQEISDWSTIISV